ncbi:MAG TPA: hypothetical protein VMR46_02740 [Candidatus Paceibacterota bacterium]|jgi:hypothetical protein|nr:hypothetical protein [Candidatus Paceibacterota bacterium]
MSLYRSLLTFLGALVITAAFVPAFAFAQSYNCTNGGSSNNWSFWNNGNTTACTPGDLLVYVQVTNNVNNGYTTYNEAPSNFTVAVSGLNASPATFAGSLSGTQVSVGGSYSVTALQLSGYSATYSSGCTGTLEQGESGLCVITESNTSSYYNQYPSAYPYNYYYNVPLSCTPSYQTVNLGQTATFTANGGDYSQYNWQTPQRSYLNIGAVLNVAFTQTGTQTVSVTNGTDVESCTVNVVASGAPVVVNSVYPNNTYGTASGSGYGVYVTPTYIPSLPNTGFAPMSSAEAASAVALMIAMALVALPYVRKAFTVVLG